MHEACRKIICIIIAFIMLIPGLYFEDICMSSAQEMAAEKSRSYISVPGSEFAEEHICAAEAPVQLISMRADRIRSGGHNRKNTSNILCDLIYDEDCGFSGLKMTGSSNQNVRHIKYSNELAVSYIHRSDGEK